MIVNDGNGKMMIMIVMMLMIMIISANDDNDQAMVIIVIRIVRGSINGNGKHNKDVNNDKTYLLLLLSFPYDFFLIIIGVPPYVGHCILAVRSIAKLKKAKLR